MTKKIMILGASILQLPAIIEAKNMGLEVIAVDMDKNAIGFKEADFCVEVSTIDIPKVLESARKHCIDGIMTLASDMPMRTVAAIAEELNLVGISEETAFKVTNKAAMRQCLQENGVPIPLFFKVNNKEEYNDKILKFSSRFIVKSADNSGSRGVFLVNDNKDKQSIDYAFEYSKKYSRSGEIVVEEYMEGPEVSVEALSIAGEVHIIAITDKLTTGAPRFVEMGHSQPSQLPKMVQDMIKMVATSAIKAMGIEKGPSHTEIIVTDKGPKIVELGARLGGDNITTHLVPLSTGVDMVKCSIEIALGQMPNIRSNINMASAIIFLNPPTGKISKISGIDAAEAIDGVKQILITKNIGDSICEIMSSVDRVGYVISQAKKVENAISICESAIANIVINIER